jgi:MSHA biogenesis protein MshP
MTTTQATPAAVRGLGVIAVLLVLVLLATLAAAIVRLGFATQTGSALDALAARAVQAARAGGEWGQYQALKGAWTTCAGANQTLDLSADLGMHVTVSCQSQTYQEGETVPGTPTIVRIFSIDAVACNRSACPDNVAALSPGYVERRLRVQASN